MDISSILRKKRDGNALSHAEIVYFVKGVTDQTIPDYQLSAMLMALYIRGMSPVETRDLTMAMAHSGQVADLSGIDGVCVDKHSTGGVGDTTTLVLVPLAAACGAKVAKMSGRGLGHTGGTLDKLESIPGMRVELSMDAFVRQVREIDCAVIGQTGNLAPADKRLYSLRDVTQTVDSQPLIVSSIMSKKIAAGTGAIVLDVKTGSGALMQTLEDSVSLARAMVEVGKLSGKPTFALVTGMDQPLGTHIGNALEVREAIDILAGRAGGRLLEVSLQLGAMMLVAGGYAPDLDAARQRMQRALDSGAGLETFARMIEAQGGDPRVCDDVSLLPQSPKKRCVTADRDGYVVKMDTAAIGDASQHLGAGRVVVEDSIDPAVGLVMVASLGDAVRAGDVLAELHGNTDESLQTAAKAVATAITIADAPPETLPPLVFRTITPDDVGAQ